MPDEPVVDASPLIISALGDRLELLRYAGRRMFVPEAVAAEIRQRDASDPAVQALSAAPWLEIVDTGPKHDSIRDAGLNLGEAEVLTWALNHPGTLAILDERPARRLAVRLGVPLRGTLGLVLAAKRDELIPAARPVIEHLLQRTSWYLAEQERDRALRLVGE